MEDRTSQQWDFLTYKCHNSEAKAKEGSWGGAPCRNRDCTAITQQIFHFRSSNRLVKYIPPFLSCRIEPIQDPPHEGFWRCLLLGQDLRTQTVVDLFDGVNIYERLAAWEIPIREDVQPALEYFRVLPNGFGLIKGPWGTGKTWLDVVITRLLISLGKRVKVLSPSNKSADSFVLRLNEQLQRLRERGHAITDKRILRFHSWTTERQVNQQEKQRFVEPFHHRY